MGKKSRAKRERREGRSNRRQRTRRAREGRPHPLVAVEARHRELAERLAKRGDRFSELISKMLQDEHAGQHLVTRSGLSADEYKELASLRPDAHDALRQELEVAHLQLRKALEAGDAFHSVAMVQFANLFSPWGSYYEPTHEGSEADVELVCGFLATQPPNLSGERLSPAEMQSIFDELDHIRDLGLLFNLSMPTGDDLGAASLRFSSAMRWMSLRGTSFGIHGRELAEDIYRPHDDWLLGQFGFTVDDVLEVGESVAALTAKRVNDLGREGEKMMNRRVDPSTPAGMAANIAATLEVFDAGIRASTVFSVDDLVQFRHSLDPDRVRAVLDELSIEVGSLRPGEFTGLFDVNPLRERPFLRWRDEFLLAIPGMVTRDADALLEHRLLAGRSSFPHQRAKTLDLLAVRT